MNKYRVSIKKKGVPYKVIPNLFGSNCPDRLERDLRKYVYPVDIQEIKIKQLIESK